MATVDTIRPIATDTGLRTYIISLFNIVSEWNDRRVTRSALGSLSDRELDDIGLVRGDIDDISAGTYRR